MCVRHYLFEWVQKDCVLLLTISKQFSDDNTGFAVAGGSNGGGIKYKVACVCLIL